MKDGLIRLGVFTSGGEAKATAMNINIEKKVDKLLDAFAALIIRGWQHSEADRQFSVELLNLLSQLEVSLERLVRQQVRTTLRDFRRPGSESE